jgi:DHA2 family multidrug resistance protein
VTAAVGLVSLVVWEWFQEHPIVEVRLYRNVNFLGASTMIFVLGIMLFATLVLMPQFLQSLVGYSAQSAGLVLSGGGLVLVVLFPIVGTLAARVQARFLIAFGWFALGLAMVYSARHLDREISFGGASLLRITQVVGLPFLFVPINLASYVGMPVEKSNSVAGLMNFMRNMGSSIGTSMVTTLVARGAQFHQVHLAAHATPAQPALKQAAGALAARLAHAGLEAGDATRHAYALLYRAVIGQATTLAYIDTFWVLAAGATFMFALSFGLQRNDPHGGGAVAVH